MTYESTQDGMGYRVCLTEDGITACTFVSSAHLIDDKRRQLEAAIRRTAAQAFGL